MENRTSFFDAVFFDMDGLMVDSEPQWFQSEIEVTNPFGYTWLEEDQIACLQTFLTHIRRLHHDQIACGSWQQNTRRITVDKTDQATAIKPRIRRVTAPAIRRADQAQRTKEHVFGSRRKVLGGIIEHRLGLDRYGRGRWPAGAGADKRGAEDKNQAGRGRHVQNNPGLDAAFAAER